MGADARMGMGIGSGADGVAPRLHFPSLRSTNPGMGDGAYSSLQMLPNHPAAQFGMMENGVHQQGLSYVKKRRRGGGGGMGVVGVTDGGVGVVRVLGGGGNGRGGRGRAKRCKLCCQFKKGSHGKNGKECPICPACRQNRNEERWAAAHQPGQPCGVPQDASGQLMLGEGTTEGVEMEKVEICGESERVRDDKGGELTIGIEMEG